MAGWILCVLWIGALFTMIRRWRIFRLEGIRPWMMSFFFAVKLLAAAFLLWLYTFHYSSRKDADIYKYFDDGQLISSLIETSPQDYLKIVSGIGSPGPVGQAILANTKYWDRSPSISGFNDNRLIIRVNALLHPLTLGNVYTHMVIGAFISFIGLSLLLRVFAGITSLPAPTLAFPLFLLPTILIWSSGMLKESFSLLGMAGMISLACDNKDHWNWKKISAFSLSVILLMNAKLYLAVFLIPALIAFRWSENKSDGKTWLRYLVISLFFIGSGLQTASLMDLDLALLISQKQAEFKCLAEWMNAGSIVHIPDLNQDWTSFAKSLPYALYNTMLRPAIWDSVNVFSAISMLEILVLWSLFILSIFVRDKRPGMKRENLLYLCLVFSFALCVLIGWTTPVLGAIVRYRMPVFVLLLPLAISYLDHSRIKTLFKLKLKR